MRVTLETFLEEVNERTTENDQYPVLTSSKSGLFLQSNYFNKQVASKDNTGYKIIRRGEFTYRAMSDTGEFFPNMLDCADIGIVSPAYPVFKITNQDIISPQYLKYFFKSKVFQYSIAAFVQGSTRTSVKFSKMKAITIDFSDLNSKKTITTVEIPAEVVEQIADAVLDPHNDANSFEVILSDGTSIEFDAEALEEKVKQADGLDITISIEHHEDVKVTDKQKEVVGDRPAFDINVTSGGEHISDMGGKITVHAPYELKKGEKAEGIVVYYVDDHGNKERCETSYNVRKKLVNWKTDHLSLYMIAYEEPVTPEQPVAPAENPFKDVSETDWFYKAVMYVSENGLMSGVDADNFGPSWNTTRGMITTILWRMEGKPAASTVPFADVDADMYYADAIAWAAEKGIVSGYGDTFGPEDNITREQLASILWRYAKYKGYDVSVGEDTNILSYGDAFSISEYAIPAMQWACGEGIISGNDDGTLNPGGYAQRAHAAQMLMKFLENVK